MNIENRLKKLRHFEAEIESKKGEIAKLRSEAFRTSKFLEENEQKETSENLNCRIITQSDCISKEIEQMYQERDKLIKLIDSISDPIAAIVIRLYYLDRLDWVMIRRKVHYSIRHLQRKRNKGLEELERLTR